MNAVSAIHQGRIQNFAPLGGQVAAKALSGLALPKDVGAAPQGLRSASFRAQMPPTALGGGLAGLIAKMDEASLAEKFLDNQQLEMARGAEAEQADEIQVAVEASIENSISEEEAAEELTRIKKKCQENSRLKGRYQMEHCIALLREMSSLTSEQARTFLHGWAHHILRFL